VKLAMVTTAEWHRELIAYLAPKRPSLSKAQVVSVRRATPTDEAGLLGYEMNVDLITHPARLWQGEAALIDANVVGPSLCSATSPGDFASLVAANEASVIWAVWVKKLSRSRPLSIAVILDWNACSRT
jgi:hypothetical protein